MTKIEHNMPLAGDVRGAGEERGRGRPRHTMPLRDAKAGIGYHPRYMANCVRCGRQLPRFSFGKKVCQWCAQHDAAQRGEEVEEKQRVIPPPWVQGGSSNMGLTQVILGANVAVFLGMLLASGGALDPNIQQLVGWGANWGPLTLSGQWWRFFTYMFLHGGILHIAFNMWCLWDLGTLCETLYGRWTFAAVYLVSGIAGGVASVAWNPLGVSVGASGAIFGLAGALIASFYLGEFSAPRVFIQSRLRSLMIFAGYNLLFGAISSRTDNAAHVGGLVTGLALGALIALVAPQRDDWPRRVAVLSAMALVVAGGAIWLQRTHHFILQ